MSEALQPRELEQDIAPVVLAANGLTIITADDRQRAIEVVRQIKGAMKRAKEFFSPLKKSADEAKHQLLDAERQVTEPLKLAEATIKDKAQAFDRAEEEKREAERARLQAIADEQARKERERAERAAAKQRAIEAAAREQAEAKRREAAKADATERARLEAEADKAERKANDAADKADAKQESAAAVSAPVVQVATAAKSKGEATRTTWKARCTSLSALADMTAGNIRLPFLAFDQTAANRFAAATKGVVTIPGIEFYSEQTLAIRSR